MKIKSEFLQFNNFRKEQKMNNEINDLSNQVDYATDSAEQIQARANLDAIIPELPSETLEAPEPAANAVDSLYGLFSLLPIGLNFAGMKKTAEVWADSTCHGLAAACVPVFRKYAWGHKIINFLETGAGVEEMALFAVAMPIGMATFKAVQQDTQALDNASAAVQPNPTRSKNGIEIANESDVKFANGDYEPTN